MNTPLSLCRHIAGFLVGVAVFLILIPFSLWYLSSSDMAFFTQPLLPPGLLNLTLAYPLFLIGLLFTVWSNLSLICHGKGGPTDIAGLAISPQTKKLVVDGPYRYSRNPMVFGVNSIYFSLVLYFNSLGCFILVVLFVVSIVKLVVAMEEKRLEADFGNDYLEYKTRTSMIIPWWRRNG